jgi:predicted ATP-dependent serine protease
MNFRTLGFKGVWKNFIGDPNPGFTAMVYGKPKFGKSILCIRFADYLSRNHGSVLYVAREERIGGTLKEKAQEMNASEVDFVSAIPSDLSDYEFVFLDSISKLGLSPEDLDQLRIKYPRISFVFVFQTTKQGAFRGQNSYQHDVDVVIELPEPGKAIQYGRYNQGGEMDLFES